MTRCDELWALCKSTQKNPTDAERGVAIRAVDVLVGDLHSVARAHQDVHRVDHQKLFHKAGFVGRIRYVPATPACDSTCENQASEGLVRVGWASTRSLGTFGWALKLFPEKTPAVSRNLLFISVETATEESSPLRISARTDVTTTSAAGRFVQGVLATVAEPDSLDTRTFSQQGRALTLIPVVDTPVPRSLTDALATMRIGQVIAYLHDGERFLGRLELEDAFITSEFADTRLNFRHHLLGTVEPRGCPFATRVMSGLSRVLWTGKEDRLKAVKSGAPSPDIRDGL
jgi:hypothetical protein